MNSGSPHLFRSSDFKIRYSLFIIQHSALRLFTTKDTKEFTRHTNNYTAPESQIPNHYSIFVVRYSLFDILLFAPYSLPLVSGTAVLCG
jgi:hypothetical protein